MSDELRSRIAELIYGDGEELAWNRAVQIADTIIWELGWHVDEAIPLAIAILRVATDAD